VGERAIPQVPRPEDSPVSEVRANPNFSGTRTTGYERESGSAGAPSVPPADLSGGLWPAAPIDVHYQNEFQGDVDPYRKVNNPATRGMFTWVKDYINGIAFSNQEVDANGFRTRSPQQRTSHMRITPPPHGDGYDAINQMNHPYQQPQTPNTYKYMPQTGTQAYGTGNANGTVGSYKGVLNSDAYGAGQTAGGIGGNQYVPTPGPPDTTSIAGSDTGSGYPTWG